MGTEKHCVPLHSTVQRTLCHPLCFYRAFRYCALFVKSGLGCKMDFIMVITDYMKIKTTVQCALSFSISCFFCSPLSVYHPVSCSYCRSNGMTGFRYRCLRCRGYQLCQNCFWRGNTSGSHSNKHQMKEHSSWVSHGAVTHPSQQGALAVRRRIWTHL